MTDDEIRDAIKLLAQTTGIFTEAAGRVTIAVLAKLAEQGELDPDQRVVAYITGEGLKTRSIAPRGTFEDVADRADRVLIRAGGRTRFGGRLNVGPIITLRPRWL